MRRWRACRSSWQTKRRFVFGYRTAPSSDKRNAIFKIGYWALKFGHPNDEALSGHRYYRNGLTAYSAYEVIGSEWIEELRQINQVSFPGSALSFPAACILFSAFTTARWSSSHRSDPSGFSQTAIFCLMC
jgi:hypothetical protein